MRVPSTADLAMPRVGDHPYLAAIDHAAPELQRRPEPNIHQGNREAPPSGSERVAVDRAQGGAALVRARQWIKRRNAVRVPSTADLAMPRVGDDPLPRGDRSCVAPELQRSPRTEYHQKRNSRSAAQPARSGSRCRPRSGRRRPRAREAMDKEEERGPLTAVVETGLLSRATP